MKYQIKKSQIAAVVAAMAALSASPNIRAQVSPGVNQFDNNWGDTVNIDTSYANTVAALNALSSGGGISATVQTNVTLLQGLSAVYNGNLVADTATYNGWVSTVATDNANIAAQNTYIANEQAAAAASLIADPFDTSGNWAMHNAQANAAIAALPGFYTTLSTDSLAEAAAQAVVAQDNQKINLINTVIATGGAVDQALAAQASAGAQFTNIASNYAAGPSTANLEDILTSINSIPGGTSATADATAGNAFTVWGASGQLIPDLQTLVQDTILSLSQLPVTSQTAVDTAMELASNGAWERHYIAVGNNAIAWVDTSGAVHIGPHSLITSEDTTGTGGTVQSLYAHDVTGGSINIDVNGGSTLLLNGVTAASVDDVSAAVSGEAATRAAADTALSSAAVVETNARIAADAAESSARIAAVNAESSARISGDTALSSAAVVETNARIAGDTALSSAAVVETNARIAADNAEAATRLAADNLESTTRAAAIAAEAATRAAGDTALSSAAVVETNARIAADNAEAATRAAGDTALSSAAVVEAATRAAADVAESSARIAADTLEANTRSAAVATLTTNLATETATRIANDTALSTQISTETANRVAADLVITNNINKLRRGVAMAAALQTPTIDAGKNSAFNLGVSNYDGKTGIAAGFAHRAGEGVSVNLSVATTSDASETVVRGGINWSW